MNAQIKFKISDEAITTMISSNLMIIPIDKMMIPKNWAYLLAGLLYDLLLYFEFLPAVKLIDLYLHCTYLSNHND